MFTLTKTMEKEIQSNLGDFTNLLFVKACKGLVIEIEGDTYHQTPFETYVEIHGDLAGIELLEKYEDDSRKTYQTFAKKNIEKLEW